MIVIVGSLVILGYMPREDLTLIFTLCLEPAMAVSVLSTKDLLMVVSVF